jgi:hypothetical protein
MVRLVVAALQWLVRNAVVLLVIMALLAGGSWAVRQVQQLRQARSEAQTLERNRTVLQAEPARVAGWLATLLAGGSDAGDALLQRLATERARREAERAALASDKPALVHLPGSDAYLAAARLDIEIGALRQAEAHLRTQATLAQALGNAEGARRTLLAERAVTRAAIEARLGDRRAIVAAHPLLAAIPLTWVRRDIDRLDAERQALVARLASQDASLKLLEDSARLGRDWQRAARSSPDQIAPLVAPLAARLEARAAELDRRIDRNAWRRVQEDVTAYFVPALLILAGALLTGPLVKTLTYFVLAPMLSRCAPIRLLAHEGGELRPALAPGAGGRVSSSTLSLVLAPDEELRVHADYVQTRDHANRTSTVLWLDPTRPFTSLAADMALVQRVLPGTGQDVKMSSTRQDLIELALLDLPEGSAFVLRPRGLAGLVQRVDRPVRITSHWRFLSLHAWLDLQFRYLVFHGPGRLVLKGSRGVIVEAPAPGRTMDRVVNQAGVLGWSAGLERSSTRCDSFPAYLLGRQDLLNDRFQGTGSIAYEEMPGAGAPHSLVFGKGWTGLADTLLKVFGI